MSGKVNQAHSDFIYMLLNQPGAENEMQTYVIAQKMSNTGSIHDIASDQHDRAIKFAPGCRFAVVLSSYYGGKGYTTHRTEAATVRAAARVRDYSHSIIDADGNDYDADAYSDRLIKY